jgi:hypothetical protein
MSKNTVEDFVKQCDLLDQLNKTITAWNEGKISLTGIEYHNLVSKQLDAEKLISKMCPHDQVTVAKGTEVDQGYGTNRYYTRYDLVCNRCNTILLNRSYDDDRRAISEPTSLEEAVKLIDSTERLPDSDLKKLNMKRNVYTVEELKVIGN